MTSKRVVLIIDDSLVIRQQVALALEGAGYEVLQACDGQDGLEATKTHPEIAMVICDVTMPRMTGLQFLDAYRGPGRTPPVPVVMLTTDGSPDMISQAKRSGARGWIVKPFQADRLVAAVHRITNQVS